MVFFLNVSLKGNDMVRRVALFTGVTGQDGAFLAELLLGKGYIIHGIKRRSSSFNTGLVDHLYKDRHEDDRRFVMHHGDLTDATNIIRIMQETQPDEIYNLAAQSHVQVSFETPVEAAFEQVGRRIEWRGTAIDEKGMDAASGRTLIEIDPRHLRPTELDFLIGDVTKTRDKLGWRPGISFDALVAEMVDADLVLISSEARPAVKSARRPKPSPREVQPA